MFWEQLARDIRYAGRMMAANPLFSAMATLSLALGIGANTAIYSFMDAILMRALPVQRPESLVLINWHAKGRRPPVIHSSSGSSWNDPHTGLTSGNMPYGFFEQVRDSVKGSDSNPVLASVFGYSAAGRMNLQIAGQADTGSALYVSGGFFNGLGVPPAAGRLIDLSDDEVGAPPVATVSYGYAQRRFGEAAKAVGQAVLVNDNRFTIVGVTPAEFFGVNPQEQEDIYLPVHTNLLLEVFGDPKAKYAEGTYYWIQMMGRLRPGVARERAQAALAPMFQHFVESTTTSEKERTDMPILLLKEGAGGMEALRRQYSQPLYILMTLVALILAIACANIANLLLARATVRRREMALRLSLGAGRARVVRQLLTESVVLALTGGLLGIAIAKWGIRALTVLLANGREDFTLHAELNWHVLAVTFGLSIVTGTLFGLAPALESLRVDLISSLKQTRAGERKVRIHRRLRLSLSQVLAVTQIAVSLLLLVAAGLFVRTLTNLNSVSVGFDREHVLLVSVNARQAGYKDEALMRFYDNLQERFRGIPGVRAVSLSQYALVSNSTSSTNGRIPGLADKIDDMYIMAVGPDFFGTMRIPVLLGRDFDERDNGSAPRVAVVNEVLAKAHFGTTNPVGRHIIVGGGRNALEFEIVGVSKAARYDSVKSEIPETVDMPYSQNPRMSLRDMVYELRAAGDPMALAGAARRVVHDADARIPVLNVKTQAEQIDQTIGQERTFAMLCTCFAVLAVGIAFVGLYGMMAYSVARRTNEIGIRMALGAERGRLMWMVVREVMAMALLGLAIGLPAAMATTKFVGAYLFRMKPNDPAALGAAAMMLIAAALLAGYGPARRASRVDPWIALRDE